MHDYLNLMIWLVAQFQSKQAKFYYQVKECRLKEIGTHLDEMGMRAIFIS